MIIFSGGSRIFREGGGGGAIPKLGVESYYLVNIFPKLHENVRNWNERGGARPWRPLGSANGYNDIIIE